MIEKITRLINVKSIVTIMLTIVFCYLSAIKIISAEQFISIFTVVIAFYFGTQVEKKKEV
jgi:hypothetical protein